MYPSSLSRLTRSATSGSALPAWGVTRFWRSRAFHRICFVLWTASSVGQLSLRKADVPIHSDLTRPQTAGLVEVLDRVLDKGLFVGGDIKISLAEVELLTIRIRLIVCSLDKARDMGLDWWTHDRHLSPGRTPRGRDAALEARVQVLERQLLNGNGTRPLRSTRDRRVSTRAIK